MSQAPRPGATPNVEQPRPRPNARWICGYQHLGLACTEGPTDAGVCCQKKPRSTVKTEDAVAQESAEQPAEAANCDQNCSCAQHCELAALRNQPTLPSHDDLGPCIPQRTPWFSRQTIGLNAAILTGGVLLLCMALPVRESVFVPGELSGKHAQILGNRLVSQRCSLCHPTSHGPLAMQSQDELCMKCHEAHMPDAVLRSPHDLAEAELSELGGSPTIGQLQLASLRGSRGVGDETKCAMCHVEHHGTGHDLKKILDARCQSCHRSQFESFSHGHPQFDGFPYRTRRRIAFDHQAHADKHFAQKNEDFDCRRCHVDRGLNSNVGPVFRSLGFEQACAQCHDDSLRAAAAGGWALLQLPSIEAEDSLDASLGLGTWPADAQFGYEGHVSLPLRLLLTEDSDARETLRSLPASGKLEDIDSTDDRRARAVRHVATATQHLIYDVAANGHAAWKRRLLAAVQSKLLRPPNAHESLLIDELCAGLPPDLFRAMSQQWFRGRAGLVNHAPAPSDAAMNIHRQLELQLVSDTDLLAADDDLLAGDDDLLSGDDLVGSDKIESLLLGDAGGQEELAPPAEQLLLDDAPTTADDDSLLLGSFGDEPDTGLGQGPPGESTPPPQLTKLRGSEHVVQGGWYLDVELYALRYMPRGHADPTLAAWIELAAILEHGASHAAEELGAAGRASSNPDSVLENCRSCHQLGRLSTGNLWENWKVDSRPDGVRPFTKFNHAPHLTLPAISDCRYCHVFAKRLGGVGSLDPVGAPEMPSPSDAAVPISYPHPLKQSGVARVGDEFVSMEREQCSACHRPGAAGDGCSLCHNYHVGADGFRWSQSLK